MAQAGGCTPLPPEPTVGPGHPNPCDAAVIPQVCTAPEIRPFCDGSPAFTVRNLTVGSRGVRGVAIDDLNGDCAPDIVLANDSARRAIQILYSDNQGVFGEPVDYEGPGGGVGVAVGNFDNDPWPDVVVSARDRENAHVLFSAGFECAAAESLTLSVQQDPQALTVNDFNDDGRMDIAIANYHNASVSLFLGRNSRAFFDEIVLPAGPQPEYIASSDFDGDGCMDLAVAKNKAPVGVQVHRGLCDGSFSLHSDILVSPQGGYRLGGMASGDLNGDGLIDLVVTGQNHANAYALFSNGDGTFDISEPQALGRTPLGVVVADLNNDGLDDFAVSAKRDLQIDLLISNGDGTFLRSDVEVAKPPVQIAASDLDNDGDIDLVATHEVGELAILTNRCGE